MLKFRTHQKLNIHVIGSGGTGGYFLANIARLFAGGKHKIHVYDGDRVELKNLKRQNFKFDDLDKNKAEALVEQLTRDVYECPTMIAHPGFITDKDEFAMDVMLDLEADESLVVILAVDNVATRKLINDAVYTTLSEAKIPTIVMDSGNHDQGGQVVLYANAMVNYAPPLQTPRKVALPSMLDLYPEMANINDTNPGITTNCAEAAEAQPQAMMCNVRNGDVMANTLIQLYERQQVAGNLWRSDALTGNTTIACIGVE